MARSLGPVFRLALTDKVPGVYLAGLTLLRAVTQPGVIAPRECASLAADLAPLLIEKVGPSLARCICHTSYSKMCMKDLGGWGDWVLFMHCLLSCFVSQRSTVQEAVNI